ncbi:hypothetical protein ACH4E5_35720 [Streptomyces afghaniensis]|uniref:hypothetical protein n=1 Tax=Streptomyces afghaniensis TaxID=66865 RepID=UPI0037A76A3C
MFFTGDGVDEVPVDAQHDGLAEVAGGDQGCRDPAVAGGDQVPDPGADRRAGDVKAVQARVVDLAG